MKIEFANDEEKAAFLYLLCNALAGQVSAGAGEVADYAAEMAVGLIQQIKG